MAVQIVVPELGESVLEATVGEWLKKEGEAVQAGEALVELETDKVNVEISAPQSGVLARIERQSYEDVKVGDVLGSIEPGGNGGSQEQAKPTEMQTEQPAGESSEQAPTAPEPDSDGKSQGTPALTPVARRFAEEQGIDAGRVRGSGAGGRVTRADLEAYTSDQAATKTEALEGKPPTHAEKPALTGQRGVGTGRAEERVKMSRRRRTIAQRLVEAQQTAAMLTTFNEIHMSAVMELRKRRGEEFLKRNGVKLGFMSFFVKASLGALKAFPRLNAEIEGDEMVFKHYYDIGIAIGDEEGLVVPVLQDADRMSFAAIEKKIAEFVEKTQAGKLALEDLRGGTFTITNGGVFGSLLSTPILTPPQAAILGMHKIEKRPVVVPKENGMEDEIAIRPMMYAALSYDHRIVDGREAVQFLVKIKELIEDPESMLLEG